MCGFNIERDAANPRGAYNGPRGDVAWGDEDCKEFEDDPRVIVELVTPVNVSMNEGVAVGWSVGLARQVGKMEPSQEEPTLDLGGLWLAGRKGVMNVE